MSNAGTVAQAWSAIVAGIERASGGDTWAPASSAPRWVHAVTHTLVWGLVILVVGLSIAEVNKVVIGPGRLITPSPTIVIKPLDRSIIRELYVRPGQKVAKGDLIASLDATFSRANLTAISSEIATLAAQKRRLESEMDYLPFVAGAANEDRIQQDIFGMRQQAFNSRVDALDARIQGLKAGLNSNREMRQGLEERAKVVEQIVDMRTQLVERQAGARLQLLQAQDDRLTIDNEIRNLDNQVNEIDERIAAAESEKAAFAFEWRKALAEELAEVSRKLAAATEEESKAKRLDNLVELRAPSDAVITEIARKSVGSVLDAAEPIATMVPSGAALEVEVDIPADEIGYVLVGNDVKIKLTSLPFQQFGLLRGRLDTISGDVIQAEGPFGEKQPVYRSRASIVDVDLRNLPPGFALLPGMQVSAEIEVGKRTLMSYILNPITKTMDQAMREPG